MKENNYDNIQLCLNIVINGDYDDISMFSIPGQIEFSIYRNNKLEFDIVKVGQFYRPIYVLDKKGHSQQCFKEDLSDIKYLFDICKDACDAKKSQKVLCKGGQKSQNSGDAKFKCIENKETVKWQQRLSLLVKMKQKFLGIKIIREK